MRGGTRHASASADVALTNTAAAGEEETCATRLGAQAVHATDALAHATFSDGMSKVRLGHTMDAAAREGRARARRKRMGAERGGEEEA